MRQRLRWFLAVGLVMLVAFSSGLAGATPAQDTAQSAAAAPAAAKPLLADTGWTPMWYAPGSEAGDLYDVSVVGSTVVAVGASGIIYRSTDGGDSWALQLVEGQETLRGVHMFDANRGIVVGDGGTIYMTTNGGGIWQRVASGTTETLNDIAFVDAQHGWIVGQGGTVLHTTDGGQTWTAQASGTTKGLKAVSFADAQNGWAVGASGTVLHTTDGGQTWTAQNPVTIDELRGVLAVSATEAWLTGRGGVLRHTTDGGATWQTVNLGTTLILFDVARGPDGRIWVAANGGKVYVSSDGATFTLTDIGKNQPVYRIQVPAANTVLAVGGTSTIADFPKGMLLARTTDGGASWRILMKSVHHFSAVSMPESGRIFAVGEAYDLGGWYGRILLISNDGGRTWTMHELVDAVRALRAVDFADTQRGVIVGRETNLNTVRGTQPTIQVFLTTDGGNSWTFRNLIDQYSDWFATYGYEANGLNAVRYLPNGRIWASGDFGILHTSTDNGATWKRIEFNPNGLDVTNGPLLSLDAREDGHIWITGLNGLILTSTDNGTNWSYFRLEPRPGVAPHLMSIRFLDERTGWAAGYRNTLWKTTKGGQAADEWELISMPSALNDVAWQDVHFFNPQQGILVGGVCTSSLCEFWDQFQGAVAAITVDGGFTWHYEFLPGAYVLYDIAAISPDEVFAVGDNGLIARYTGFPTRLNAFLLSEPLTVDGNLGDWPTTITTTLNANNASYLESAVPPSKEDISATASALWYEDPVGDGRTYLYLSFQVRDDVVRPDGDAVIIGLDSDRNGAPSYGDHALRVSAAGVVTENGQLVTDVMARTRTTPDGYTVEVAIPDDFLAANQSFIFHEQVLGFSFALEDDDGAGREHYLVSDGRNPASPSPGFGTITIFGDTITLQRGKNAYSRVVDAYIFRDRPDDNFGEFDEVPPNRRLRLGWSQSLKYETRSALFGFDLSFLPPDAEITEADLYTYVPFRFPSTMTMDVAAYGVLKPWAEKQVTWNRAANGAAWDVPGANGEGTDRDATPADVRTLDTARFKYKTWWTVTDIVQRIHEGTAYGILLRPIAGNANGVFTLISSEEETLTDQRPYLMFTYRLSPRPLPTPTPTPTATPTPTPTPTPTWTPTPTATPTPTPTPTPAQRVYIPLVTR